MVSNYYHSVCRRLFYSILAVIVLLFIFIPPLCAQKSKSPPPPLRERLFYGGSFGLQLGTYTDIEVSPIIGLWLLPRLAVAAGPNYRFYKDPVDRTDIYGGRIYTEFVVIRDIGSFLPLNINMGIFFHAENELLSLESEFWKVAPVTSERFYQNTVLAGGGISQQMGRRSSMNFIVLWALNDSMYGVYSNPEIRVSLTF
jgi:hypothetical protein